MKDCQFGVSPVNYSDSDLDQTFKLKSKAPTFRLESHRIQFEFNLEIEEGLEKIVTGIRQQDAGLCNTLISKLKRRNKLIKGTDRSPGGWITVREYEACVEAILRTIES